MEGLGGSGSGETMMEAVTETRRERMLAARGMLRNNQAQDIWRENGENVGELNAAGTKKRKIKDVSTVTFLSLINWMGSQLTRKGKAWGRLSFCAYHGGTCWEGKDLYPGLSESRFIELHRSPSAFPSFR